MIALAAVGLGLLTIGLNLILIWLDLRTSATVQPTSKKRLVTVGTIVTIIGVLILGYGIFVLLNMPPLESGLVVLFVGLNIACLGIASLIKTIGYGHECAVRNGAFFTTGLGAGLILAYCLVVYLNLCAKPI